MSASTAATVALSIATGAMCFGVGYVCQMFVKAVPFSDDPRPVTGTHNLYTVEELKTLKDDKERVNAYYNRRADLHDVLGAAVGTKDPREAYPKLEGKEDLKLLKKAIEEFYPDKIKPVSNQTEVQGADEISPEDRLSTDALRPQLGGGVQPPDYLPVPGQIGVGR